MTFNLTVNQTTSSTQTITVCDSFVLPNGVIANASGVYSDTLINRQGCDSILTIHLTINNSSSQSQNITLCLGQSTVVGANTYSAAGIYRDTLIATSGCDSIIITNLTVNPLTPSSITFSQDFCESDAPVAFAATPAGGTWVGLGINATTGLFTPSTAGVGIQTIVYVPTGVCPVPDTIQVTVFSDPQISFSTTDELCDQSDGSILTTVNGGTPVYQFNWSNGAVTQDILGIKEGIYSLVVTDVNGCSGSESATILNIINPDCEFGYFIPNIFSPDGNGENDVLFVEGTGIETLNLIIYNRYGNKVFETSSQSIGWDGTYRGQPVNPEVYVYRVEGKFVDGKEFKDKGTITIVRR